MRVTWTHKRLAEVCTLQRGFDLPTKDRKPGDNPLVSSSGIADFIDQSKVRGPGVVTGRSGSIGNVFFVEKDFWPLNTALYVKDFFGNDERFVFLLLQSLDLARFASGTGVPTLNRNHVSDEIVCVPESVEEQRRIVSVLDEAFAAISTATANAEKNLANARELFEARLGEVFSTRDAGWRDTQIGQIANASYGYTEKASFEPVGPKFLRITDIQEGGVVWDDVPHCIISEKERDRQRLKSGDIVFARTGATTGKSFLIKSPPEAVAASYLIRLRVTDPGILPEFIQLYFQTPQYWKLVNEGTSGSAQGGFNASKLAEMHFSAPSIEQQWETVEQLSIANAQRLEMESVYESKIAALNALKQSVMHRAFSGELASNAAAVVALNDNFATPEFAAKIVAFAYERHVAKNRVRNFGTVKAEKILHMVEAVGGVDLGRQPLREAAGPDDAKHRHATWDWARSQHFFRFNKRNGGGHDFEKLSSYPRMIEDARTAIASTAVEKAIELLVDMDRDFAELIATTYAAWNNLIIDQCAATDGDIVLAARDKWHRDKLRFDPSRFHDAIRFIRNNSIVPDGSAKRVGGQEALLL